MQVKENGSAVENPQCPATVGVGDKGMSAGEVCGEGSCYLLRTEGVWGAPDLWEYGVLKLVSDLTVPRVRAKESGMGFA